MRLYVLGRVDLLDADGKEVRSVLAQPRRLALLAYLALTSRNGACRRDKLLGMFWPELTEERARQSLNKAVHYLRRTLGEAAIVSRNAEELSLDPSCVACDATAFADAIDREQMSEALELYRGELLPAFYIDDAQEFEAWVDSERTHLRRLAARAAHSQAQRTENERDFTTAIALARRAVELADEDERAVRDLLGLLDRLGDRAGALSAYDKFARRMAAEFRAEPAAETRALIERVRARSEPVPRAMSIEAQSVPIGPYTPVSKAPRILPRKRTRLGLGTLAVAVTCVVGFILLGRLGKPARLDPDVVAVLPFRVTGADPSLSYLQEGMVDLLAANLAGEGGPRAVDPRTVISAWRQAGGSVERDVGEDEALVASRRVGAGQLLIGSVVGTPARVEMQATLLGVPSGRRLARAQVAGSPDSLLALVDSLTAQLLARRAGESRHRLKQLTSTSLPALRAYLDAQTAYRRGLYRKAAGHFESAVELDSGFALAALGLAAANYWATDGFDYRAVELAWAHRDRLSERDRALAAALAGPRYARDRLRGLERAVDLAPDRPETWYWLGETYFHLGSLIGVERWRERAGQAFEKAAALDSAFAAPLEHLLDLAAVTGDLAGVRRFGRRYLAVDSTGPLTDYVRWRAALALGDAAELAAVRQRLDSTTMSSVGGIIGAGILDGIGLEDVDRAIAVLRGSGGTRSERFSNLILLHDAVLDRGRPSEAVALTALIQETEPALGWGLDFRVLDALFGGGDTAAAAAAARELAREADGPGAGAVPAKVCVVALWRAALGDSARTASALEQLRAGASSTEGRYPAAIRLLCAASLQAWLGADRSSLDAAEALAKLDTLMARGPLAPYPFVYAATFIAARLHERRGDPTRALAAVRQRFYHIPTYLSTQLREEGRLAALSGDREGAIHAYQHYLALHSNPEPAVAPAVAEVRMALVRILAEQSREQGGRKRSAQRPRP